jgi:predicted acylesterase/phospholipase RssA
VDADFWLVIGTVERSCVQGIYHIGVAAAIKEYMPDFVRQGRIAGCSAGSLVAASFLCNCCLGQATSDTLKVVIQVRAVLATTRATTTRLCVQARSTTLGVLHPRLDLMKIVHDTLNDMLPHNAHEICTRRLFVSLTRFADGRNVVISDFASKEELIQASPPTVCPVIVDTNCTKAARSTLR